jgi:hypothetical protein
MAGWSHRSGHVLLLLFGLSTAGGARAAEPEQPAAAPASDVGSEKARLSIRTPVGYTLMADPVAAGPRLRLCGGECAVELAHGEYQLGLSDRKDRLLRPSVQQTLAGPIQVDATLRSHRASRVGGLVLLVGGLVAANILLLMGSLMGGFGSSSDAATAGVFVTAGIVAVGTSTGAILLLSRKDEARIRVSARR